MIFIQRTESDPYFNLATEEYVLKNISEDVFMLWQNSPSVVVGKHQNAFAEINLPVLSEKNIPVIRRISGGGTVYHDEGNLNYTLITNEKNRERMIDFKKFSLPVVGFLKTLNLEAKPEGKNNLVIEKKKISGNAAHVHKSRVMHHGTLLFNSKLDFLEKSIRPPEVSFHDKAVRSVRATVGNISDFLQEKIGIKEFKELFFSYLLDFHSTEKIIQLDEKQKSEIADLANKKYKTWEWNFGYSPTFTIKNQHKNLQAEILVKNGLIQEIRINGIKAKENDVTKALAGKRFKKDEIEKCVGPLVDDEKLSRQILQLFGFLLV